MYSDNALKRIASESAGVNALDYSGDYQTATAAAVKMMLNDADANTEIQFFRLRCNTNGAGAFSVSGWWSP